MSFRISSKNIFLTYPQSGDYSKEDLSAFLSSLPGSIVWMVISQEDHAAATPDDVGGKHLHAAIGYDRKRNIQRSTFFDIPIGTNEDGSAKFLHPNIQPMKSKKECIKYVRKDGDFLDVGDVPSFSAKRGWGDIIASETYDDFMANASEIAPRDFVIQHANIEAFAKQKYAKAVKPYEPEFTTFKFCQELHDWWCGSLAKPLTRDRKKSLVLRSPSKYGKTEWARSLGRHMYFNANTDFNDWDTEADYMVLDDIAFRLIPNKKALFGCQKETTINAKYARKRTVKWGKPVIYLTNTALSNEDFGEDAPWWRENCTFISLVDRLY